MGPPGVGCLQLPILIQINIDIESEYYSTCTTSTSNTIPFINVISSLTLLQIPRNQQRFWNHQIVGNKYLHKVQGTYCECQPLSCLPKLTWYRLSAIHCIVGLSSFSFSCVHTIYYIYLCSYIRHCHHKEQSKVKKQCIFRYSFVIIWSLIWHKISYYCTS